MKTYIVIYKAYGCKIETDIYPATNKEEAEKLFEEDNEINKWGHRFLGVIEYA